MAKTCDTLPINTVGPFEQTLFLGCSIQSVSTSLGWNEQQSTLTVTLVEDDCVALPDKPKVYYPAPGKKYCWHDVDPGFTSPTIGAPVYFRIGSDPTWPTRGNDLAEGEGFEFAGIIQSWTKDASTGGNPTYSVQIVDPRLLLQNLEIIISDYAGSAYGGSGPSVYNLINAYGWLEYTSKAQGRPCPQEQILGANFGSPAGGFGNSMNNNEGTPWHELRNAIQYLLCGATDSRVNANTEETRFSPYGFAKFRGARPQSIAAGGDFVQTNTSPNSADHHGLQGFGLIGKNEEGGYDDYNPGLLNDDDGNGTNRNAHGLAYIADYIIDIREIPFTPRWYRLAGPSMNLLDMISQICGEAGSDYYVELLLSQTGQKIIKVRSVKRAVQPEVGGVYGIEQFVSDTENVTSKNISRELRNEPTSVFVYGGYVQTVYQQINQAGVQQYWGKDAEGVFQRNCRIGACSFGGMPSFNTRENGDWAVELDVRPLNLNLSTPLAANSYWMSETELRMALGDFDAWYNYVLIYKKFTGTAIGQAIRSTHNAAQNIEFPSGLLTTPGVNREALANMWENLMAGGFEIKFAPQDPGDTDDTDLKKIHGFIQNWADTYYGKQFLVQLPFVCYSTEPDSMQTLFSDTPTNDGGYPAEGTTQVLDLAWQDGATPEPLDYFSTEQNKILPFARYHATSGTGAFPREGDYIVANNSLYVKGSVEEHPVAYTTPWGTYATALLKVENPIEVSGSTETQLDNLFAGAIQIAFGADSFTPSQIDDIDFSIRFQPDGGGRADSASFSIAPKRRTPNQAAIPMKSNTTRYGPLSWAGPPGPVTFVPDDGLVPWEYGGYGSAAPIDKMWGAMVETARDALSFMQVGERGSINFPGYPTRRLGAELRSSQDMMNSLLVENENFTLLQGGTFTLKLMKTIGWDAQFGPNITNIAINIGEGGFTTNYTLSTFSPSFGRFAKYNANKLKQSGKQRAAIMRMQRDQNKLRRALVAAQGRSAAQMKNLKSRSKTSQAAPNGAASVVAGTSTAITADHGAGGNFAAPNTAALSPHSLAFGNPKVWPNQAFMSQDGLTRPVSNDGTSTNLPQYATKNTTNTKDQCADIPHTRRESNPPFNGTKSYAPCIIDIDYLDPWAGPSKQKHDANSSDATNHSDIGILSHGATAVAKVNLYEYTAAGNSYPASVRGIATKGPLLMHGWGYDIDGKPIPNEADTEAAASGGTFEDANLKDNFLSHYLRKPHTWPVGPVDLRWDRKRAVWTTPSEFKIIKAKADGGAIAPGASSSECVTVQAGVGSQMGTASNPVYDGDGNLVGSTGNIKVSNPSFQPEIPSGESFYAIYDSIDCTYYPIFSSGGSGTGLKVKDSASCGATANYPDCTGISCLSFSSGLSIVSITGGEAQIVSDHYITATGASLTPSSSISGALFRELSFGECFGVRDLGDCKFEIFSSGCSSSGSGSGFNFKDTSYCHRSSLYPDCTGATCLNFGTGLSADSLTDGTVTINADHYISATGAEFGNSINNAFFQHLSFGSGMGVRHMGDCKYEISCECSGSTGAPGPPGPPGGGGGGGGSLSGFNMTCANSMTEFCGVGNLDAAATGAITGLIVGPGLSLYNVIGGTYAHHRHYLETTLKVQKGTASSYGAPGVAAGGDYVEVTETISLGSGLRGDSSTTCSAGGSTYDVCDVTINLDCESGPITEVRYVDDICCTGDGFKVIYKNLQFRNGLFCGVDGDDSC